MFNFPLALEMAKGSGVYPPPLRAPPPRAALAPRARLRRARVCQKGVGDLSARVFVPKSPARAVLAVARPVPDVSR